MTNNEEIEDKGQIQIVPATSVNFDRKNDLVKTLKRLDKGLETAFKLLEDIIADKEVDKKVKVDCAKFLIDRRIAVSTEVSRDNLARAIASSRLILAERATQQRVSKFAGSGNAEEDEDEDSQPVYVPNMILKNDHISQM